MEVWWVGGTQASTYMDEAVRVRTTLADAAKRYDWSGVFGVLSEHPEYVNAWRLDGPSWYAPLHQAASGGAPIDVVQRLVELGAWRSLQNACGERPLDIAVRKGQTHLRAALEPVHRHQVPPGVLLKIQAHFHAVIRGRVDDLVSREQLRLPELEPLLEMESPKVWFPVPGMYGGFSYVLDRAARYPTLVVESWCRVAGGSGQRHEVTCRGSRLVEEGFA